MHQPRLIYCIACCVFIFSCTHHDIQLDIVRHVPYYFENSVLFGEDRKKMEEKNEFILFTGKIDTTDEVAPVSVAYISVHKQTLQLDAVPQKDKTARVYQGNGYTVLLLQEPEEWNLVVMHGQQKSVYHVFEQGGYR